MGRATIAFALVAGLAASQDANSQQVKTPAQIAAEQRPNYRAKKAAAATTTNDPVAIQDEGAANGSRFVAKSADAPKADAPKAGEGAPFWQPIENPGEPMDYFRYWGTNAATTKEQAASPDFNNEVVQSKTDPHRPQFGEPVVLNFQQSAPIAMETQFAACPFRDQPDKNIFWFNPYANPDKTHTDLGKDPVNHPYYRYGVPGEWTISQPYNGVRGLSVTSATEGNAPGAPDGGYAVSTTYVTNRRCSDGNDEYGFWKEIASPKEDAKEKDQETYFYYSIKTNCSALYGCRASDSWDGPGQDQTTGPLTILTHIQSGGVVRRPLAEEAAASTGVADAEMTAGRRPRPPHPDPERPGQQFTYSAYLVRDDNTSDPDHNTGYKFRVQVTEPNNPSQFAKCSINGGPLQDCQTDVPIASWWPARQMQVEEVQVVTGTQTAGVNAPTPLSPGAKMTVKGLSVGK